MGQLPSMTQDKMPDDWINTAPHEDYDCLKRQFSALKALLNSTREQMRLYQQKDYSLAERRLAELESSLESERAMNAHLTTELESIERGLTLEKLCEAVADMGKPLAPEFHYIERKRHAATISAAREYLKGRK